MLLDPAGFETQLRLIKELCGLLEDACTDDELMEAYAGRFERVSRLVSIIGSEDIRNTLIDAAFAARHRQLVQEREQATALERIREADGPGWVTLAGSDQQPPVPGFKRLEMRLPDGLGLYYWVESDPDTYRPRFAYELLRLDPTTGELLEEGGRLEHRTYNNLEAWEGALGDVRRQEPVRDDPGSA